VPTDRDTPQVDDQLCCMACSAYSACSAHSAHSACSTCSTTCSTCPTRSTCSASSTSSARSASSACPTRRRARKSPILPAWPGIIPLKRNFGPARVRRPFCRWLTFVLSQRRVDNQAGKQRSKNEWTRHTGLLVLEVVGSTLLCCCRRNNREQWSPILQQSV